MPLSPAEQLARAVIELEKRGMSPEEIRTEIFGWPKTRPECTCGRSTCRCTCDVCGSRDLKWVAWGAYLDKDLICQTCNHLQDVWNC